MDNSTPSKNVYMDRSLRKTTENRVLWGLVVSAQESDPSMRLDLNPFYQRGLVWSLEQKVALIDSICSGLALPALYIREYDYSSHKKYQEVLDGKQRISTIIEFMADGFEYRGVKYSEWGRGDKIDFRMTTIGVVLLVDITDAQAVDVYNRLNFNGTPHTEEDRR